MTEKKKVPPLESVKKRDVDRNLIGVGSLAGDCDDPIEVDSSASDVGGSYSPKNTSFRVPALKQELMSETTEEGKELSQSKELLPLLKAKQAKVGGVYEVHESEVNLDTPQPETAAKMGFSAADIFRQTPMEEIEQSLEYKYEKLKREHVALQKRHKTCRKRMVSAESRMSDLKTLFKYDSVLVRIDLENNVKLAAMQKQKLVALKEADECKRQVESIKGAKKRDLTETQATDVPTTD